MEDIQINEERLSEWLEKNSQPKLSWVDKLYHKTNHFISMYFHEVSWNYQEWKERMMDSNQKIEYLTMFFKLYPHFHNDTGFCARYFKQKDYVRFKTRWDTYSRLAKNPTITEFIEFQSKWIPGVEKTGVPFCGIFDFEELFINQV